MSYLSKVLHRMTGKMPYLQQFYLVQGITLVALLLAVGVIVQDYRREQVDLSLEMTGMRYEKVLQKLFEDVIQHKLISQRMLSGNVSLKSEVARLETQIDEGLKRVDLVDREQERFSSYPGSGFAYTKSSGSYQELVKGWKGIKESTASHQELLHRIKGIMEAVGENSSLILDLELPFYYLAEETLFLIPEVQLALTQALALLESFQKDAKISTAEKVELLSIKNVAMMQLDHMTQGFARVLNGQSKNLQVDELRRVLEPYLQAYQVSSKEFLDLLERKLGKTTEESLPPNEIAFVGSKALDAGFRFWNYSGIQLEQQLQARDQKSSFRLYSILTLVLGFYSLALLLAFHVTGELKNSFQAIYDGTNRFAAGDLSVRLPENSPGLIGKLVKVFNNIAQNSEMKLKQLAVIIEATQALSKGDFSARAICVGDDPELVVVVESFNGIAKKFEAIVKQLHQLGINLTTSATEIAAASKQQEAAIVEQEATAREISVTAHEISTTAKEFANTVRELNIVAEETSGLAVKGKESLAHMETIMGHTQEASHNIANKLAVLNEKAGNITTVITTITKVADQTNLLSLNAAIEAEKAADRGFAVIAREIRRLADQTALATLDIERIVSEIMGAVSSSVMSVDEFIQEIRQGTNEVTNVGTQLTTIIEQVQTLTIRFESVNQGMQSQATGAEQINESISLFSQTAQQTTESIHQFRNTIQQLSSAATDLRSAISKLGS